MFKIDSKRAVVIFRALLIPLVFAYIVWEGVTYFKAQNGVDDTSKIYNLIIVVAIYAVFRFSLKKAVLRLIELKKSSPKDEATKP